MRVGRYKTRGIGNFPSIGYRNLVGITERGSTPIASLSMTVAYIDFEAEAPVMEGEIESSETAIEIAREYAADNCVGEWGEVLDTRQEDKDWIVEFRTHTFSDAYEHHVQLSPIGNVVSHDRTSRFE